MTSSRHPTEIPLPAEIAATTAPPRPKPRLLLAVVVAALLYCSSVLVLCFLCGLTPLIAFKECFLLEEPRSRPVDVAPLMELDIPAAMDLSVWENSDAHVQSIGSFGVFVDVQRYATLPSAGSQFEFECEPFYPHPEVTYGGEAPDRFCISDVEEIRNDIEGGCRGQGKYNSYAIVQRGNVVISVFELSTDPNSADKDAAIAVLAAEIQTAAHPGNE